MNTSTNTTARITARATPVGFRRRTIAGALLAMTITGTAVGLAATSRADLGDPASDFTHSARPDANCRAEPFGFLGSQRRTLCDDPIAKDGSWTWERTIWVPAHRTVQLISNETYPVRPETVLPDEPGHVD